MRNGSEGVDKMVIFFLDFSKCFCTFFERELSKFENFTILERLNKINKFTDGSLFWNSNDHQWLEQFSNCEKYYWETNDKKEGDNLFFNR